MKTTTVTTHTHTHTHTTSDSIECRNLVSVSQNRRLPLFARMQLPSTGPNQEEDKAAAPRTRTGYWYCTEGFF